MVRRGFLIYRATDRHTYCGEGLKRGLMNAHFFHEALKKISTTKSGRNKATGFTHSEEV